MSEAQNIQWFPGHMAKTRRKLKEYLGLVDAVAEIVDARIPASSRNPDLAGIITDKPRIVLLNKCDMADPAATEQWIRRIKAEGATAIAVDCKSGKGLGVFKSTVKDMLSDRLEAYRQKGISRRPSGLRKTRHIINSLAHRTTWLRSDLSPLTVKAARGLVFSKAR